MNQKASPHMLIKAENIIVWNSTDFHKLSLSKMDWQNIIKHCLTQ